MNISRRIHRAIVRETNALMRIGIDREAATLRAIGIVEAYMQAVHDAGQTLRIGNNQWRKVAA